MATASHYVSPVVAPHGVDVFFDNTSRMSDGRVVAKAKELFRYISGLGANAVSLNFPLQMNSITASTVYPTQATPSPELMRTVIDVAEADHLEVQLRPLVLIVGGNLVKWRGVIEPTNALEWFQSYWESLEPYAVVAAQTNVSSFSVGAEFNSLVEDASAKGAKPWGWHNYIPLWQHLDQQLQAIVGNRLLYSAGHVTLLSIPGIGFGFDEYTPVVIAKRNVPTSSTPAAKVIAEFQASMNATVHKAGFPALTSVSLEEVELSAYAGAWKTPWIITPPKGAALARWVQADWDTALCNVFLASHMGGIYFWSLELPQFSATVTRADTLSYGGFFGTATAKAISACFARAGGR
jgi:hypothetical protein